MSKDFTQTDASLKPFGLLSEAEQMQKLVELHDLTGDDGTRLNVLSLWGDDRKYLYEETAHWFGFIDKTGISPADGSAPIQSAALVAKEEALKDSALKITLGILRVAHYPGGGRHNILFKFTAQNQISNDSEEVAFTRNFIAQEGTRAGVEGFPLFIGLNVGKIGLTLRCQTVNVANEDDEKFLSFLNSDLLQKGLQLASTVNPAIGIVSSYATGIFNAIGKRNQNITIQDFTLGLDFSSGLLAGGRLKQGSYVAIQAKSVDWTEWVWDTNQHDIVGKNSKQPIPYNYVVFSLEKIDQTAVHAAP